MSYFVENIVIIYLMCYNDEQLFNKEDGYELKLFTNQKQC